MKTKQVEYEIPRRFNEFFELYSIFKRFKDFYFEGFPKKTLFSVFSENKLEIRRQKLEEFLKYTLDYCKEREKNQRNNLYLPFFEFLEVREYMGKLDQLKIKEKFFENEYDKKAIELLGRLNFEENNRLTILKEIKCFFTQKQPKLSFNAIRINFY